MQLFVNFFYWIVFSWNDAVGCSLKFGWILHDLAIFWCGQDYSCFFLFVFWKMRSEFVLELNLVIFLFICKGKERRFLYDHAWSTDLVASFSAENVLVWLGIGSSASLTPLSLQDKFSAELHVLHFMICLLLCFRIPFLKEGALTFCTVMLFSFIVNAPSCSSACLSLWDDSACSLYPHSFVVNVNNGMSLLIDEYGLESCKLDKFELVVYRS